MNQSRIAFCSMVPAQRAENIQKRESIMGSVASTASHAIDQVKDSASSARGSLIDLGVQAMKFLNSIPAREVRAVDSVLGHIGLQRRESALRPLWFFAAGAVVAGAVALIVAPTSGKKLRGKIRDLFGGVKEGVEKRVDAALAAESSKAANGADVAAPQA